MMSKALSVLIALALILQGCTRDQSDFIPTTAIPEYTNDILGVVMGDDDTPIVGAQVRFNGKITLTDIYGIYQFKHVEVSSDHNLLTIEQPGYFSTVRVFGSSGNGRIALKNNLLPKKFEYFFDATNGGSVSEANITFQFPANAFVDKISNQPYEGQVKVAIGYIDPLDPKALDQLPGSVGGLTESESEACLSNYGIIVIEAQGIIGVPLSLATGKTIRASLRIPGEKLGQASNSTKIWGFDNNLGYWRESGQAILNANNQSYEAQLNDLAFYAFAEHRPAKKLTGRVIDETGRPLAFASVRINDGQKGFENRAFTDDNGRYNVTVPANTPMIININKSKGCTVSLTNDSKINAINENTTLPDLRVKLDGGSYTKISGKLSSCNGNPVHTGYAYAVTEKGSWALLPVANGGFEGYLLNCNDNSNVTIIGVNSESNEYSNEYSFSSGAEINTGVISACTQESDFVALSIPELNFDTITYSNILFVDGQEKTLEASLPLTRTFFGINWSDDNKIGVRLGTYPILANKGYIAIKNKVDFDFYKAQSGSVTITHSPEGEGLPLRGIFTLYVTTDVKKTPIKVVGSFKATYKS